MAHYGIGSCYAMRQVAGSESVGGLEIKVRHKSGEVGSVEILATDWRTGETLEYVEKAYGEVALEGVKSVLKELNLPFDDFDITLHKFLCHPVDSNAACFRQAGRSAFRSAIEGLFTGRIGLRL
ncbi:hypothetical protein AB1K70_12380 [Bremerella sp. JC770]|uniref:hypothetical protein n=1 Tax=Bremerella sp. JC770 TaxID=3232137 RepID=UPI00345AEDAC